MLLIAATDTELVVEVTAGNAPEKLAGTTVGVASGELGDVIRDRHIAVVDDLGVVAEWAVDLRTGPALLVPLIADGETLGALAVAYRPGEALAAEGPEVAMVETFAGQAALALERARAQEEREMLAVVGDRERIARDLHDVVIQRLFAAGMQLQGVTAHGLRPQTRERIDTVVGHLDTTIRDIRGAIFELRTPATGALRTEIRSLVEEARPTLGFRPELVLDGPVDSAVPESLRPAVVAVLREALANAARHARAGSVSVLVRVADRQLTVQIADDGVGMAADVRSVGGVRNMQRRADELGGTCTVDRADPHGTVVTWTVPL
jgi:signal transduction histidine kinase